MCVILQFLIRHSLPRLLTSWVVCLPICQDLWVTEDFKPVSCATNLGPRAHKPHSACVHQLDGGQNGKQSIAELTVMLQCPAFGPITGKQLFISNILFQLKDYFSLSFLLLRSNKDVICRSGKGTGLCLETAEADFQPSRDNTVGANWYGYLETHWTQIGLWFTPTVGWLFGFQREFPWCIWRNLFYHYLKWHSHYSFRSKLHREPRLPTVVCTFGKRVALYKSNHCVAERNKGWQFWQDIHLGPANPGKIHCPRKVPYGAVIISKVLSRAINSRQFWMHRDLSQVQPLQWLFKHELMQLPNLMQSQVLAQDLKEN